ncbi:MAG: AAA family ATPase [[Clostridium] fimetarium]|nr:AAA family ATPase [Alistipes timonensis]MCM1405655.1 AAA family ATPase [[Clostridium] fimetarium]
MLFRKAEKVIYEHLAGDSDKVLVVCGARQVGKSYIIRHVGRQIFKNVVEINLIEDFDGEGLFRNVKTTEDFYFALGIAAGDRLGNADDTLVFLDEIQQYPHLLTMLKFLRQEGRYRYAASGSLLGVTLKKSTSIPLGSIQILRMYPLDFEEFLIANGVASEAIGRMRDNFKNRESLDEPIHDKILSLYKRYLLVGGMPDAVNVYLATRNIVKVREVQRDIHDLYAVDASKYDEEHRLKIARIYELVPSNLENKKKRLVYKDIDNVSGRRADDYIEEIDYLVSSGITLEVRAISNPLFPLKESEQKNLLKLYLNDPGLLTSVLYRNNVSAVLRDEASVNLGSVYECAVAAELAAHDNQLFYYDNRTRGEVDYLVDDYDSLSVVPIEVKSGKDYKRHSALSRFVSTPDYNIKHAYVLSNSRVVESDGKIIYMPIYFSMFLGEPASDAPIYI